MISHSTADVQSRGHSLHVVNGTAGRVEKSPNLSRRDLRSKKSSMPIAQSQRRRSAVIDLTGASNTQEKERPTKRPRLASHGSSSGADGSSTPLNAEGKNVVPGTAYRPLPFSSGRPAWTFQVLVSDAHSADTRKNSPVTSAQNGNKGKPDSVPLFPTLLLNEQSLESPRGSLASLRELSPDSEVQTTPYQIEVPAVAPVLKDSKVADFSPWTGNHPEDVLNEQTMQQGFYDKSRVSQNESNTARPSLYTQLKHRSGLQVLSSVFTAVLEKRQTQSMIITPSTFKPPPRVTLTDNKREAWLRDLANPAVPLRRLSRTIPHGIRGKLLLDQCLGKSIPIGRAVWLARCVGANEIRAFKRKGTSGSLAVGLEAKWVRDWTISVQQFIEGVLSGCGTVDWKVKVTYVLGLSARLFLEHLLDHDQYMEWLLSSLETSTLNVLPFWLAMLGTYWKFIMRYRKRSRRLAEILLEKLQIMSSSQASHLRPLIDRIAECIRRVAREQTSSIILPESWGKYKDTIASCLNLDDNILNSVFKGIVERNLRVQRPRSRDHTPQRSPGHHIIQLLDSVCSTYDLNPVSATCLDMYHDKAVLVYKLLEWTATPFRFGLTRIYICVRLLRKWKTAGLDVDSYLLSFIQGLPESTRLDVDSVYHVISELVRSQTFSVGRYLQWLMARGISSCNAPAGQNAVSSINSTHPQNSKMPERKSGEVGLLAQLPISQLPEHVQNLRNALLVRAGLSASDEASIIEQTRALVCQRLPAMFQLHRIEVATGQMPRNLTWTVKSEVAHWLRCTVAEHRRIGSVRMLAGAVTQCPDTSALTPDEFYVIRDVLEDFGDLSMLADILQYATDSDDFLVLASVADTLNYHFGTFTVIGAMKDLFRRLVDAYVRLKGVYGTNLDLLYSLIGLGLQVPNEGSTVALLRQELSRIENKSALTAPSPISDHIPEAFTESEPSFLPKLEQILASGAGMDEATLDTIFTGLTTRLISHNGQGKPTTNEIGRFLMQLRSFLPKHFDVLLIRWIWDVMISPSRPELQKILVPLVGVGCVTLQAFSLLLKKLIQAQKTNVIVPDVAKLQIEFLKLLVTLPQANDQCPDLLSYRFQLAQQELLSKHGDDIVGLIQDTAFALKLKNPALTRDGGMPEFELCVSNLLHGLLLRNPEDTSRRCVELLLKQPQVAMAPLQKALDLLLGFDAHAGEKSSSSEAEEVIGMTDDLSLPFCQLKLQALFSNEAGEQTRDGLVDVLFRAAVADQQAKRSHWVELLSMMSHTAVQQIRERAEKHFLATPFLGLGPEHISVSPSDDVPSLETPKAYLAIVEELAYSIPDTGFPPAASMLVARMESLLQQLANAQTNFAIMSKNSGTALPDEVIRSCSNLERAATFWCSGLLRMVVLHRLAFIASSPTQTANATVHDQSRLLILIFCLALFCDRGFMQRSCDAAESLSTSVQNCEKMPFSGAFSQGYVLDVAASLIDLFPDEARHRCARFLNQRCPSFVQVQDDPRFVYLLGPYSDLTGLNTPLPASIPSPAGPPATPSSGLTTPAATSASQQAVAPTVATGALLESLTSATSRLRLQHQGHVIGPYHLRPWELLEDAAPIAGLNDTAIGLGYFDTRRVRA